MNNLNHKTLPEMSREELGEEKESYESTLSMLTPEEYYLDAREPIIQRITEIDEFLKQQDMWDLINKGDSTDGSNSTS